MESKVSHKLPLPSMSAIAATMEVAEFYAYAVCYALRFQKPIFRQSNSCRRDKSLPCVKGGGLPKARRKDCNLLCKTIPQTEIKDFCQPPLHKGAFLLQLYALRAIIPKGKHKVIASAEGAWQSATPQNGFPRSLRSLGMTT